MFSVIAMKSRTFSSLLYSTSEQVCRRWEGARPGRQPKIPSGNILYHGRHTQCVIGGGLGDRNLLFSHFHEFESSLVWEVELF